MHPELAGSDKWRWENMPTGMWGTGATPLQHIRKWQLIQCHSEKEVHQMLQCFSFCRLSWGSSEAQKSVHFCSTLKLGVTVTSRILSGLVTGDLWPSVLSHPEAFVRSFLWGYPVTPIRLQTWCWAYFFHSGRAVTSQGAQPTSSAQGHPAGSVGLLWVLRKHPPPFRKNSRKTSGPGRLRNWNLDNPFEISMPEHK